MTAIPIPSKSNNAYVLFKHPLQLDTLSIVRFLCHKGHNDMRPVRCIERNHPAWAHDLPSIELASGERYVGLGSCIQFYAQETGQDPNSLLSNANAFNAANPDYRLGGAL